MNILQGNVHRAIGREVGYSMTTYYCKFLGRVC